ncbi:hypothetical protein DAPPUDRAFT_323315 [Daphnia pulex]|uniref:Vacuolar protein sorting-associated protein 54 n=1 Tax=Daphnia pulex TaxID=6669 RepID=E9GYI9_DAPPU|nr:hypothetical protein DAPPUDRAFT_323315 [Daphnia pulex]|eukprot:EFX75401.1 hypothetical protein DAPPUDRAFT_323315 [Daphnia pulex]
MAVSKTNTDSISLLSSGSNSPTWRSCSYCLNKIFKTSAEFTRHLRDDHCSQEGGSFVCRYGYNGVCTSLPVEGVSDRDYEDHVMKHHAKTQDGKDADGPAWNVNAACQNMAAILNDPKKGKQKDFFTRTWGDGFVENTTIPESLLLPIVDEAYFTPYLKKISKRYKKSSKKSSVTLATEQLTRSTLKPIDGNEGDLSVIPQTFLQPTFNLSQPDTFHKVFPFIKESGLSHVLGTGKTLQEKLSYYLDLIEMQIAHQISHKSEDFFQAVASHDAVREELGKALTAVKALRLKVNHVDATHVQGSLKVLQRQVARQNYAIVYRKLKLMATVHQTQPTIQLLLSTSDFVGALDLIGTTQEVVQQELMSIHCFRYLSSQLKEMENLIENLLSNEFERLTTAELNRPLKEDVLVTEEDRLTAVLYGMLRQRRYNFIELFKDEGLTAMKALMKQTIVEALAANDTDVERGSMLYEQLKHLNFVSWTNLMQRCMTSLKALLNRIRAIHDIMALVLATETSRQEEVVVTEDDRQRLQQSLKEMIQSLCDSAHDQCGRLLSSRTKDGALLERVSSQEFVALAKLIETFVLDCHNISGHKSMGLRLAFQGQATRFVQKFHEERRSKLGAVLDSERWRQAEISPDIQANVDTFFGSPSDATAAPFKSHPVSETIIVRGESYVVVGAALFFLPQLLEYCNCVDNLPTAAPDLLTRLVELLKTFNSRTCQLVLGAGALPLVGLKTISSRNLALASRSLQLIALFIPLLKAHFEERLAPKQKTMIKHFDQALKDFTDHIAEIENKLLTLLSEMAESYLSSWEIKPPVPSVAFRAISKQMAKLHEAINPIWPSNDVQNFYSKFNASLKKSLQHHISKHGVQNNGGPQHGLVTSELIFYVSSLKSLNVLRDDETVEVFSKDLWNVPR